MIKITVPKDCENAPRKLVIKDFNIAFVESDIDKILEFFADDIEWNMVGNKTIKGKEEAKATLESMIGTKGKELIINTIITHGKYASADGIMTFDDGSTIGFCDVYTFENNTKEAKIKSLTSYGVEISS